jgi:hypothetical protein
VVQNRAWLNGEPTIDDVMADPIVLLVMRSDGVKPEEVWETIRTVSNPHLHRFRRSKGKC